MDQQTWLENQELTMASKPILELEGLCKRFGSVMAVDDVSLTINRGEFFCLLGASGCGKTTLMRLIAGFEIPDSGRMILDDAPVICSFSSHERGRKHCFWAEAVRDGAGGSQPAGGRDD